MLGLQTLHMIVGQLKRKGKDATQKLVAKVTAVKQRIFSDSFAQITSSSIQE
jgi:hypothetical protein